MARHQDVLTPAGGAEAESGGLGPNATDYAGLAEMSGAPTPEASANGSAAEVGQFYNELEAQLARATLMYHTADQVAPGPGTAAPEATQSPIAPLAKLVQDYHRDHAQNSYLIGQPVETRAQVADAITRASQYLGTQNWTEPSRVLYETDEPDAPSSIAVTTELEHILGAEPSTDVPATIGDDGLTEVSSVNTTLPGSRLEYHLAYHHPANAGVQQGHRQLRGVQLRLVRVAESN